MKKSISILMIAAGAMLLMNSCAASFLDQQPDGSTITQSQYEKLEDALEGTARGIYASMHQYGGDHDVFGARAIDMYSDFTCGDMALKKYSYGWFQTDEFGQSYTRRSYVWGYYYDIIHACNLAVNLVHTQLGDIDYSDDKIVKEHAEFFYLYAQILTIRGWAYANIQKWFCYTPDMIIARGYTLENYLSAPIYDEKYTAAGTTTGNPLSTAADVYRQAEKDLNDALDYYAITEAKGINRGAKNEVNSDVARLTLAYSYLNKGEYDKALDYAEEFINKTNNTLLPYSELTTTGFAELGHNNWVWGQDVTVQSTTSLASFFGQVDVYSYSYAWAGDIKGIDANLYDLITKSHKWDARANWWNNLYNNTKNYQYAPDGKFFSPGVQAKVGYARAPKQNDIDRDWLCDQVYMRTELGYIIAAEAAVRQYKKNNDASYLAKSAGYLTAISDNRVKPDQASEYAIWVSSLGNDATLLEEIRYTWRVEFWGEGFGLQTFRRFAETVSLGDNHARSDKSLNPTNSSTLRQFTFEIPSSEQYYNPFIRDLKTLAVDED